MEATDEADKDKCCMISHWNQEIKTNKQTHKTKLLENRLVFAKGHG